MLPWKPYFWMDRPIRLPPKRWAPHLPTGQDLGAPHNKLSHTNLTKCTYAKSHNAPFCNRNVHLCAHFYYKMVHCDIFVWYIVEFVSCVYLLLLFTNGRNALDHLWGPPVCAFVCCVCAKFRAKNTLWIKFKFGRCINSTTPLTWFTFVFDLRSATWFLPCDYSAWKLQTFTDFRHWRETQHHRCCVSHDLRGRQPGECWWMKETIIIPEGHQMLGSTGPSPTMIIITVIPLV